MTKAKAIAGIMSLTKEEQLRFLKRNRIVMKGGKWHNAELEESGPGGVRAAVEYLIRTYPKGELKWPRGFQ